MSEGTEANFAENKSFLFTESFRKGRNTDVIQKHQKKETRPMR